MATPALELYDKLCVVTKLPSDHNLVALGRMRILHDKPLLGRSLVEQYEFTQYWLQWCQRLQRHKDDQAKDWEWEHVWLVWPHRVGMGCDGDDLHATNSYLIFTLGQVIALEDRVIEMVFNQLTLTAFTLAFAQWDRQRFNVDGSINKAAGDGPTPSRYSIPVEVCMRVSNELLWVLDIVARFHSLHPPLEREAVALQLHHSWSRLINNYNAIRVMVMWLMACSILVDHTEPFYEYGTRPMLLRYDDSNSDSSDEDKDIDHDHVAKMARQKACDLLSTIISVVPDQMSLIDEQRLIDMMGYVVRGAKVELSLVVAEEQHALGHLELAELFYHFASRDGWARSDRYNALRAKVKRLPLDSPRYVEATPHATPDPSKFSRGAPRETNTHPLYWTLIDQAKKTKQKQK